MHPGREDGTVRASWREFRGDRDNTDGGTVVVDGGEDTVIGQIEEYRGRIRARLGKLIQGSWFLI
jgi:plasmid replication initiation protein